MVGGHNGHKNLVNFDPKYLKKCQEGPYQYYTRFRPRRGR